jgi:hypothetical protein
VVPLNVPSPDLVKVGLPFSVSGKFCPTPFQVYCLLRTALQVIVELPPAAAILVGLAEILTDHAPQLP